MVIVTMVKERVWTKRGYVGYFY